MDRNLWWGVRKAVGSLVALRKESVDRNPSDIVANKKEYQVALRKESVDRNAYWYYSICLSALSLSARRAWIEIPCSIWIIQCLYRRSPQGERG